MAVDDLWIGRDGRPTKRHGRGMRWRVRTPGYPSTLHRTRAEADRVSAQRLVAGPPRPGDLSSVDELVDVWLAGKAHLSEKGLEAVRLAASYVRARWGPMAAKDVDEQAVQGWLSSLSTPRGPASASLRQKVLQCLAGALGDRVDLSGVRVGRGVTRDPRVLTMGQLRTLAASRPAHAAMVLLLGTTGLRIGECCALDVGDVDVARGRLRVRMSKPGRGRDVPVPAFVLAMLDLGRPGSAPLFTTSRGGRVDKNHWRQRHWVPMRDALGVEGLRVHDLRHTAASLAIASGADVLRVQQMLGHASARMTLDLYGHMMNEGLDDVSARMDRLWRDV